MFSQRVSGLLPTVAAAALLTLSAGSGAQAATGRTWGEAALLPGIATLNNGGAELTNLSCGSAGNCAAIGYYTYGAGQEQAFVASEVNGIWNPARPVPGITALGHAGRGFQPDYLSALSCARSGYCVAAGSYQEKDVGNEAFLVSAVNGVWGKAEEVPGTAALNRDGDAHLFAVSCPSAGNCSADQQWQLCRDRWFVLPVSR